MIKTSIKILILLILFVIGWGLISNSNIYPITDHYDGTHFFNLYHEKVTKNLWDIIQWKLNSNSKPWPDTIVDNLRPDLSPNIKEKSLRATFINHATVLLQWNNLNIITDPALLNGVGPIYLDLIKRHRAPGVPLENLPPIDYILISHNHYDHLDRPTLQKIIERGIIAR